MVMPHSVHRGGTTIGSPRPPEPPAAAPRWRSEWLPAALQRRLRDYVRGGGEVAAFADETLRRTVTLKDGRLEAPSPLRVTDAFGARLEQRARRRVDLTVYTNGEGVFDTVNGLFRDWRTWEATRSPGPGELVAAAGPEPDRPVIVGITLGEGLVIRAGLPGWAKRLDTDPSVSSFTEQAWELLSR